MLKRVLFSSFLVILIVAALFGIFQIITSLKNSGRGALKITSNVKGNVYLNDKLIGPMPLCKCEQSEIIKEGEYNLKIVPEDKSLSSFNTKVKIMPNVLTAVDRTFLPGSLSSASILILEKISEKDPQILVTSIPEGAMVSIDSQPSGVTPFLLKKISPSEHEIEIQKQGFAKKTLRIRTVNSYRLVIDSLLGTETKIDEDSNSETDEASPSADPTVITPSPINEQTSQDTVRIKSTPTGFLRVREGPGTSYKEIARVTPGDEYPYTEEQYGWIKITLDDESAGWISGAYAQKPTTQ
ncbi:PEGA domain-containing protein [Candidatus Parcubacteria bacterium]|nr:MAG: PEGA domain-containing protein [Candidatus Parcubacteria bacterium]